MEKTGDDKSELNFLDLELNFKIQICEYLNNLDFQKLYEAHPQFHDAINYAVRHKCLVIPLKWTNEAEGYRQIENINFLLNTFPLELYFLNLNPAIENLENVRRLTEQFNGNINQVEGKITIMDDVHGYDEPIPELFDYFKQIRIDASDKVHYFAVLATTEQLKKRHLLEHVQRREISYLQSLIAILRDDTDTTFYYEYMQMCHNLYGLSVLKFIPSVEVLELSECRLDSKLSQLLKDLSHLDILTLTNSKQTSELELFFNEIGKQNKLTIFSLHSKEQNWPIQIIFHNILKMTNLKELHLSIKGISYETFLPEIANNLKNLSHLEIITQDEFKLKWILDFLRVAEKINVLEFDFNNENRDWMEFYHGLVQMRTSAGKTDKLDITIFGSAQGFRCVHLNESQLVKLVLAPVVDREKNYFASRNEMSIVWIAGLIAQNQN